MDLRYLEDFDRDRLRTWLREALLDRRSLPKLTHDEPPDVAILRAEPTLEKITRRDLADACVTLIKGLSDLGEIDEDYLRALLGLAVGLELRDRVAPLICAMSTRADHFESLPWIIQRVLLEGLINLRSLQPPEFWNAHYERAPAEFTLTALAGLLATTWSAGIKFLPRLDNDAGIAFAAATLVEQKLEELDPSERDCCARNLWDILSSCKSMIQQVLGEVVGQHVQHQTSAPSRRAPHTVLPRRDPRLDQAYLAMGIRASSRRRCARLAEPNLDVAA